MTTLADAFDAFAEAAAALALELRAADTRRTVGDLSGYATTPQEPSGADLTAAALQDAFEDFEDTPQGRSKAGGCPIHGLPWSQREAGVSKKTGEPYRAFWKCDGQNADGSYCREKPTPAWVKAHPAR
jgi:hypothetical protein